MVSPSITVGQSQPLALSRWPATEWFIVGQSGFLGRALASLLPGCRGISRRECPLSSENREAVRGRLLASGPPSVVVHAAGAVGEKDPTRLEAALLHSTSTLVELLAEAAPGARLILIGSASEIAAERQGGGVAGTYGSIKLRQMALAREMAAALGVPRMVLRLHNTLGPGQSTALVAAAMVERLHACVMAKQGELLVRNPEAVRDYLDIRDVARCIVAAASSQATAWQGEIVELCSGQGRSVAALAGELLAAAGVGVPLRFEPSGGSEPDEFIGNPASLQRLVGSEPIRRISSLQSLRDMWRFQLRPSQTLEGDST